MYSRDRIEIFYSKPTLKAILLYFKIDVLPRYSSPLFFFQEILFLLYKQISQARTRYFASISHQNTHIYNHNGI